MTLQARGAFAPTFTHTQDVVYDFIATPGDIVDPVSAVVTTGNYRMCLAPTTGSVKDFLRALETAINSRFAEEASAITVAITLSAAGVVTVTFSASVTSPEFSGPVWRRLGFDAAIPVAGPVTVLTGARPVWYLALLTATEHGPLQPMQPGGAQRTGGGRVYTFASGLTSYTRDHAVSYQPLDPTFQASLACEATPAQPDAAYLGAIGSTATARQWSVLDVLAACKNAETAFAPDTWRSVKASTSERYFVGYVGEGTLLSPKMTARDQSWEAYVDWTLTMSLTSDGPTGTRA